MPESYQQIQQKIEILQRRAERLREEEVTGVIERIKVAIKHYGLTAQQLGLVDGQAPRARGRASSAKVAKGERQVKFADDNGNVWSGRGPRPHWLRDALAGGSALSDFAAKKVMKREPRNAVGTDAPAPHGDAVAMQPRLASAKPAVPGKQKKSYSDGNGKVWSGMGPRPRWFKEALAAGATAEQLQV